jgi:hypothetical protein
MTMILTVLLTLALIQAKHLIVDWLWQPPYEFMNKGTYGHWGGIRHALKNAIGTTAVIWFMFSFMGVSPLIVLSVFVLDFVIHYHTDWAKVNINKTMEWEPTKHAEFWYITGFDQFIHQMTYIWLLILVVMTL